MESLFNFWDRYRTVITVAALLWTGYGVASAVCEYTGALHHIMKLGDERSEAYDHLWKAIDNKGDVERALQKCAEVDLKVDKQVPKEMARAVHGAYRLEMQVEMMNAKSATPTEP